MAFKIVVCAKQVPDTNEIKINPETGSLIRDCLLYTSPSPRDA